MLRRLAELCLLPPLSCLLLLLLGTLLRRRRPRLGRGLQIAGVALLWLLATPAVAGLLLLSLQPYPPLDLQALPPADAIVVLSAEADPRGDEYGGAVVGPMTLQRLRYAALLQRRSGLPLLCSGGRPRRDTPPLGQLMAQALRQEFQVEVRWTEDDSADTWQNASLSAAILRRHGVRRILLVTSAWHLPRAVASFAAQGLEVLPAPTGFRGPAVDGPLSFVPQVAALRDSCLALHEWIGRLYYLLK